VFTVIDISGHRHWIVTEGVDGSLHLLDRVVAGCGDNRLELRKRRLVSEHQDRHQDVVLRREVLVDARGAQADCVSDRAHRCAVKPELAEEHRGFLEDPSRGALGRRRLWKDRPRPSLHTGRALRSALH
jgi:hypothetical protein